MRTTDNYARNRTTGELQFFDSYNPPMLRYPAEWVAWKQYPGQPLCVGLVGIPTGEAQKTRGAASK